MEQRLPQARRDHLSDPGRLASLRPAEAYPFQCAFSSTLNFFLLRRKLTLSTDCSQYRVKKVIRDPDSSTDPRQGGHSRWIINDGNEGIFDAIVRRLLHSQRSVRGRTDAQPSQVCAVGTCGDPKFIELEGQDTFSGQILHSSQLDEADLEGKRVVIVGSGASGVESAELAVVKKAKDVVMLARSDKWIIPRNTLIDVLLSLQPFGREMPLSFIPEWFIRTFHYRDLAALSPPSKGLFQGCVLSLSLSYRRPRTKERPAYTFQGRPC